MNEPKAPNPPAPSVADRKAELRGEIENLMRDLGVHSIDIERRLPNGALARDSFRADEDT